MANVMYPAAKAAILGGEIDFLSDDIMVAYIDTNDVSYNAAHEFLDDVSTGVVGTPTALTGKSVTAGVFDSDDVVVDDVSGDQFEAVILFKDTGSAATSPLIMWYDTGVTGLAMTPNGGDITALPNASGWFSL